VAACAPMPTGKACWTATSFPKKEHVHNHYAVWRQVAERVRALDLSLGTARERRAAVKRLETVPGVGPIGATPFRWTVLGLRLNFVFAESFRS
jgi:hypothetical protein